MRNSITEFRMHGRIKLRTQNVHVALTSVHCSKFRSPHLPPSTWAISLSEWRLMGGWYDWIRPCSALFFFHFWTSI